MRSSLALALTLALAPAAALADEEPKPEPKPASRPVKKPQKTARVAVDAEATLDDKPLKPNGLQYTLWSALNRFHLRPDSLQKIHDERFQKRVDLVARFWEQHYPSSEHPIELAVVARQSIAYDGAQFYGETQAHNYKGRIRAVVRTAKGEQLAELAFSLHWGKLVSSGLSKSQVENAYNQIVHTTLSLALMNHDALRKLVPDYKQKELADWSKGELAKLLKLFDDPQAPESMRKGEVAALLRAVAKKLGVKTHGPDAKPEGKEGERSEGGKTEPEGGRPGPKEGQPQGKAPCDLCGKPRGDVSPCPHCKVQ